MKNINYFKILLLLICFVSITQNVVCQEKLLSMKIVYSVPIMKEDYEVDKRFWWQSFDRVVELSKQKKLFFHISEKDSITYDSVVNLFSKKLKDTYKRDYDIKEVQQIIENNIRTIDFEERWWYDEKTMIIRSEVLAFRPVVSIDSTINFPLGWVKSRMISKKTNNVIVANNIEFTNPIYNPKPYQWWLNHLEAEYSIPFCETLLLKAELGTIKTYETPSSSEAFSNVEVIKRLNYQERELLVKEDTLFNLIEKDTIINKKYSAEEIDYFRFGQEWVFDLENARFTKTINYFSPVIKLVGNDGEFRAYYPLFYIRKD